MILVFMWNQIASTTSMEDSEVWSFPRHLLWYHANFSEAYYPQAWMNWMEDEGCIRETIHIKLINRFMEKITHTWGKNGHHRNTWIIIDVSVI